MKLVILPGNSKSNKEWVDRASVAFSDQFKDQYKHYYQHWDSGEGLINSDLELGILSKKINENRYVVLAKSAGAMITVKGVYDGILKPERCVFVGFPMKWAIENNFSLNSWLEKYDIPTLIIQNSHDPITNFSDLKKAIIGINNPYIHLFEISGDDHLYMDFNIIKEKIANFLHA